MRIAFILLALAVCAGHADVRNCVCDLTSPTIAETRGCSLCVEAEKHPATEKIILARDNDPTKPNRWLAIPRAATSDGANPLARMSSDERLLLWSTALAKAREVWGASDWGIAMNGDIARRQCHAHIHIGKLLDEKKTAEVESAGIFIESAKELPAI